MNMLATVQRTPAEAALVDAFGERLSLLPGDGAVMVKRDDAIEQIKAGLPTRRVETWHYTDLRRLLATVPAFDESAAAKAIAPLLEGSTVLSVVNGVSSGARRASRVLRSQRLGDKLTDGSFAPALVTYGSDDAIGALNTAFVADGYFVDIDGGRPAREADRTAERAGRRPDPCAPAGARRRGRQGDHRRAPDRRRRGARQLGQPAAAWRRCRGALADRAGPAGDGDPSRPVQGRARQERQAHAVRHECRRQARAPGSHRQGIRRGLPTSSCAASTCWPATPIPTSPWCSTMRCRTPPRREVIRNVVTGQRAGACSRAASTSHQIAQKTDAKMACNTLLLSDDGEFSTKPELEIFADDVACGHGATVTEIDHNHLFYLMARGIDEKTARGPAGQGLRRRGDRGTGRRDRSSTRWKNCSTTGLRRMGERCVLRGSPSSPDTAIARTQVREVGAAIGR